MHGNDGASPEKLAQVSFDPSIYSMESFDPLSNHEEFDPSDDEDDRNSSRESLGSDSSDKRFQHVDTERNLSKKKGDMLISQLQNEVNTLKQKLNEEQVTLDKVNRLVTIAQSGVSGFEGRP